jgi:hypothetical protein
MHANKQWNDIDIFFILARVHSLSVHACGCERVIDSNLFVLCPVFVFYLTYAHILTD